jgi:hypothetical protein
VAAGDTDADGHADIITGPGAGGGPQVIDYSGANGSALANFLVTPPGGAFGAFQGGIRVATADLNGDGRAEILTALGPGGGPNVQVTGIENSFPPGDNFFAYDQAFLGGVFVGGS